MSQRAQKIQRLASVDVSSMLADIAKNLRNIQNTIVEEEPQKHILDRTTTLSLLDSESENESTDDHSAEEELYESQYDSDRIAQIIARSQKAVDGCANVIKAVKSTQQRLTDLQKSCHATIHNTQSLGLMIHVEENDHGVVAELIRATAALEIYNSNIPPFPNHVSKNIL